VLFPTSSAALKPKSAVNPAFTCATCVGLSSRRGVARIAIASPSCSMLAVSRSSAVVRSIWLDYIGLPAGST